MTLERLATSAISPLAVTVGRRGRARVCVGPPREPAVPTCRVECQGAREARCGRRGASVGSVCLAGSCRAGARVAPRSSQPRRVSRAVLPVRRRRVLRLADVKRHSRPILFVCRLSLMGIESRFAELAVSLSGAAFVRHAAAAGSQTLVCLTVVRLRVPTCFILCWCCW